MSADVESILSANAALQKKVSDLENQVQKLREDLDRVTNSNRDSATADSVKLLADKIQEVDKKREADKDLILEQFTKLGKKLEVVPAPRATPHQPIATESSNVPDKGYPYTIQPNDTLSGIVVDFNAQFKAKGMKTITMKQVMEANPNVSWNRLRIGQKIFIPAPQ
jgi:LysM repeat protein